MAVPARGGRDDLLLVGTIGAAFGIKGQVKLHLISNRPEHLRRVKNLFVGAHQTRVTLERAVEHKQGVLVLTLDGVGDRTTAEELRGAEVYIHESDAAPLAEDEYFLHDLPGLKVITTGGEAIGVVKEVLETGANDVLVVARSEGGEVLIPMIRAVVTSLDLEVRQVTIEPMEGLLS